MNSANFLVVVEFLVILFVGIFIRLLPHYFTPHGAGVDHWFWKAYIEKYNRTKEFPPVLPQFLLDEHQWYPPIFPLLISRLPDAVFERYSHLIAAGIDMLRMLLVMASAFYFTGRTTPALIAGVVYALTPILISYNIQLNPRGLGALFLDIVIMLFIVLVWHTASWWLWVFIVLFSGLILLTHKMTAQLFWFICLVYGIALADWRLLLLIPGSVAAAIILSMGFYFKVLRAHWDIITFWNRNWHWLSAHPILESPIYGIPGYETPTKYFHSGFKGFWHRMQYLIGFNPWVWPIIAIAYWMLGTGNPLTAENIWIIHWLSAILLLVILTTFIPVMRCIGHGHLYLYNSSFPAALAVGMMWGGLKHNIFVNVILGITLILCIIGITFYIYVLQKSKTLKVDPFMNEAIERLRILPAGAVMCLPQHWHDAISYKAKKPVLYGAHGYGFKLVEFIFPIITKSVREIIDGYNVKYLLTYDGYLPSNFIGDLPHADIEKFGQYRLYRF